MFPSSGCGAGRLVLDMAKPVAVRCYTTYSYEGERSSVRTVGHFSCPVFAATRKLRVQLPDRQSLVLPCKKYPS